MVDTEHERCSCPDWETRRLNCKHIYAAIYVMRREYDKHGQLLND